MIVAVADTLSIYAAVAGTVGTLGGLTALGWNVWSWRQANETRVQVEVREAIIAPITGTEHVVSIKLINYSAHPIQVKAAGLEAGGQAFQVIHGGGEIPGKVDARDSGTTWLARDTPDLGPEVVGWVRVGTGETYRSEPYTLAQR